MLPTAPGERRRRCGDSRRSRRRCCRKGLSANRGRRYLVERRVTGVGEAKHDSKAVGFVDQRARLVAQSLPFGPAGPWTNQRKLLLSVWVIPSMRRPAQWQNASRPGSADNGEAFFVMRNSAGLFAPAIRLRTPLRSAPARSRRDARRPSREWRHSPASQSSREARCPALSRAS